MRMIITSTLLILFHQLLTRVAYVGSQSTENACTQNSMAVEDQGSAYSGVKMYFGDSFCQRIIQQDVTNAMKSACTGMTTPQGPSDEYKALTTKIDSLDKKADDALTRLTALILSTTNKTCRTGYDYYQQDQFCFKFYSDCKTWSEARQVCQQDGGELISLNDRNLEFFRNLARTKAGSCNNVWVGTTDASSEGQWNWQNGEKVSSAFWASGQPDNWASKENCGDLNKIFDYKLNDEDCSNKLHYLCRAAF